MLRFCKSVDFGFEGRSCLDPRCPFALLPVICLTGKSLIKAVQPLREKYSAGPVGQISFRTPAVHPTQGRIAIVTDAGLDAMDAEARFDGTCRCGRRSRVVLMPRRWH
jgi:hypothetical protein